jgi:hypothetical protein
MKNNYLQVGRTIECGCCHPEKYIRPYVGIKCECVCHDDKYACDDCQFEGGDHQTDCKHYVPTKWDIEKGKAVPVPVSTMNFKSKGIPKNDAIYIEQLEERIKALEDWRDKKIAYGVS